MKIFNILTKNKKEDFINAYFTEAFNFIYKMGVNKKDSSDIVYNVFVSLCSNEDIFNEGSDIKLLMYQGLLKSYDEYIKNKSPNKKRRTKKQYNKNFKNIFKELDNEDKKILLLYHYSDISLDKINLLIGKTISDIKISLSKSKFYIYQKYLYCKAKEDIIANYKKHLDELSFNLELKKHSETCEICLRKVKAEEELMAFVKENVINNFENDSIRKNLLIYAQKSNNNSIFTTIFANVTNKTKKIFYFAPICFAKSLKKNFNSPKIEMSFREIGKSTIDKISASVANLKDFKNIPQKTKNALNKISRFFVSAPIPPRLRLGIILSFIMVVISIAAYGTIEYLDTPGLQSFVYESDKENNNMPNNSKETADTTKTPLEKNTLSNPNKNENKNEDSKIDSQGKESTDKNNESPSKDTINEEKPVVTEEINFDLLPIEYPDDNEKKPAQTPSQNTNPTTTKNQSPSQNTITPAPNSEPTFTPKPTPTPVSEYDVNFFIPTTTPKPDPMFIPTTTPKPKTTRSLMPEPTSSPTPLPIRPIMPLPTSSPSPTPKHSPTPTPIPAIPVLPSEEPTPTEEDEPTSTPEPTDTPTPEPDPTETPTPEPDPTDTPTPTPEPTDTPTPTPDPTDTPTPTPEPTDTPTPTPEPTEPPSPTPGKGKPPWAGGNEEE